MLVSLSIALPASAQDTEPADVPAPKTPAAALRQVPTDEEAAARQAEFLTKNVPAAPLPAGSPKLDVLRDRVANLRKQQAAFLESAASPFPEIAAARPQHEKDVTALNASLAGLASEKDPEKRELASKALFAALQPIGPLLRYADYAKGYENVLTPAQVAEYQRLEAAWEAAAVNHPPKTLPLSVSGPGQFYTLTHLSVPLIVKGAPDSTVLFRAQAGGIFSNNLPIIEVKADETGLATAFWSTKGDSIAECPIDLISPAAPTDGASFQITTVKLELLPLPTASAPAP